jgi:hypothetical protein
VENIDIGDVNSELACSVYAEDIYIYLKDIEVGIIILFL